MHYCIGESSVVQKKLMKGIVANLDLMLLKSLPPYPKLLKTIFTILCGYN